MSPRPIVVDEAELNRLFDEMEWLRQCRVVWEGEHPFELTENIGTEDEMRLVARKFQKGDVIPSEAVVMIFYAYTRGGLDMQAIGAGEPAPAYTPEEKLARFLAGKGDVAGSGGVH